MIRNIIEQHRKMVLAAACAPDFPGHAKANFNRDEPRVPVGNSGGGRWRREGGTYPYGINDPGMPVGSPLEFLSETLAVFTAGEALLAVGAWLFAAAVELPLAFIGNLAEVYGEAGGLMPESDSIFGLIDEIEGWLGGKPDLAKLNKSGDLVGMKGNKKFRFDIKAPGKKPGGGIDDPHFHLEQMDKNGNWVDAGSEHRNYFKK